MEQLLGVPGVQAATGTEMASTVYETLNNCRLNGKTKYILILFFAQQRSLPNSSLIK